MDNTRRKEELQYVQCMLRELQSITASEDFLAYLIEMAYLEASDTIRAIHAGEGGEAAGEPAIRRAA